MLTEEERVFTEMLTAYDRIQRYAVKCKKLDDKAKVPSYADIYAAGADLYSIEDMEIAPHETKMVHTGLALEIPTGFFGAIYARSGLAMKQGLRPANCVGVVDSNYRGEVMVALHNDTNEYKRISFGDRVAQLIIQPYVAANFIEVDELKKTKRGHGGFGSTGK